MPESQEGGCQCRAVRYRISGDAIALAVCHCGECQRQSGSAFGMSLLVLRSSFELLSGELRDFIRTADSGRPIKCHFCPECGCRIYHEPAYAPDVFNVKAGTLDDTTGLSPSVQVWTLEKQAWIDLPDDIECFEGQPF